MDFDPLDSKKRFLKERAAKAGDALGTGLKSAYGPKPAPTPPDAEQLAPLTPPADPLEEPGMLEQLMELLGREKPAAPAPAGPQHKPDVPKLNFDQQMKQRGPKTMPYSAANKDEYGQTIPSGNAGQYTLEEWQQVRQNDPEWKDKKFYLDQERDRREKGEES